MSSTEEIPEDAANEFYDKLEVIADEARAAGCQVIFAVRYFDALDTTEDVLCFSSGGTCVCVGMAEFLLARERKRMDFVVSHTIDPSVDEDE